VLPATSCAVPVTVWPAPSVTFTGPYNPRWRCPSRCRCS
jgi:hypothetical protein